MLTLRFLPVWIFNPLRFAFWLLVSSSLFLWGIYIQLWRMGLIKYACMQEFTKEMSDHLAFVYHPFVAFESEVAIMLAGLVLACAILEIKFGSRYAMKEGIAIVCWFFRNPVAMIPFIAATFYFYSDLSIKLPAISFHPGLCIITFFAPAIVLFFPNQKGKKSEPEPDSCSL